MSLDSYNSQYPLAYYEIGTAYSFYGHNTNTNKLVEADKTISKKYSSVIKVAADENKKFVGGDGKWMAFSRAIGVVVERQERTSPNDVDKIIVMFKKDDGTYVLNKYAVGTRDVYTNEKEDVMTSETLGSNATPVTAPKIGTTTGATIETTTGATVDIDAGTTTGATVETTTGATIDE